jgi:hypothetical protein
MTAEKHLTGSRIIYLGRGAEAAQSFCAGERNTPIRPAAAFSTSKLNSLT